MEQVWNASSGKLRSQAAVLHDRITSIEFDRSSSLVIAAAANGSVVITDSIGLPLAEFESPRGVVRVHASPQSTRLAGASSNGLAHIWDATPLYRRWTAPPIADNCDISAAPAPDGRFVAIGCTGHPTRVFDTAHDRLIASLPEVTNAHIGEFATVFPVVSSDGDRAAIIRDRTAQMFRLSDQALLRTIDHPTLVSAVAFSGHELVSGDTGGTVLITGDDHGPEVLPPSNGSIDAVTVLADGRIVIADATRRLRVVDRHRGAVLADMTMPSRAMLLRSTADGRRVVAVPSYTSTDAATLWDLEQYALVARLNGHIGPTRSARFVDSDRLILTAGNDGTARSWSTETGRPVAMYSGGSRLLLDAAMAPDGSMIAAAGGDGLLRFWDVTTTRALWSMPAHNAPVIGLHFEGDDVVTRGFGGDVSRWRLPKSQAVLEPAMYMRSAISSRNETNNQARRAQGNGSKIDRFRSRNRCGRRRERQRNQGRRHLRCAACGHLHRPVQ